MILILSMFGLYAIVRGPQTQGGVELTNALIDDGIVDLGERERHVENRQHSIQAGRIKSSVRRSSPLSVLQPDVQLALSLIIGLVHGDLGIALRMHAPVPQVFLNRDSAAPFVLEITCAVPRLTDTFTPRRNQDTAEFQ